MSNPNEKKDENTSVPEDEANKLDETSGRALRESGTSVPQDDPAASTSVPQDNT